MWIWTETGDLINGDRLFFIDYEDEQIFRPNGKMEIEYTIMAYLGDKDDGYVLAKFNGESGMGRKILQEIAREIKHGKELIDVPEIIKTIKGDREEEFG